MIVLAVDLAGRIRIINAEPRISSNLPTQTSYWGVYMMRKSSLLCGAAVVFAIAACSDATGVPSDLSQAELNQLASDMDAVATLTPTDFGGGAFSVNVGESGSAAVSAPVNFSNTFSISKPCPKGGTVALAGTTSGTGDAATHSLNVETIATRTDASCAFQTKHGVVTITGNPNIQYDGKLNIVNGAFSGLQTQTHKGSFTWARGEFSETCAVDLASSWDPATHTVKVAGTFCGVNVDVTRTRNN